MLEESTVIATIAVSDLAVAQSFYSEKLGLHLVEENPGGLTYQCGTGRLFVYASGTAGTNQATSATWIASDVHGVVTELLERGVQFEHYDMPGVKWDGYVSSYGESGGKAAWFKDPDGNTLAIVSA